MIRLVLPITLLLVLLTGCTDDEPLETSLSVVEAMAGDTTGYRRAIEPRPFVFPEDHGPHPGFKLEWWYLTGNLETEGGRHFGYQFTLFRNALVPPDSGAGASAADTARSDWASRWSTSQLYMGHFALTDVEDEVFYAFERFGRAGAGLAGAETDPVRVWLEGWRFEADSTGSLFPATLRAAQDDVRLALHLRQGKPFVLQGDRGLSQKGEGAGNASYYYSATRIPSTGTIEIDGRTYEVEGTSWLDREWSTSALGEDQLGWDWFALQLSNGYDLMYYRIRQADGAGAAGHAGGTSRFTEGVLVGPEGEATRLAREDVVLEPLDTWTSPHGGRYPVEWRMRIPEQDLDITIAPYLRDQELDVSVRYWEGAMRIDGTFGGEDVTGHGYLEMTGYGDEPARRL